MADFFDFSEAAMPDSLQELVLDLSVLQNEEG